MKDPVLKVLEEIEQRLEMTSPVHPALYWYNLGVDDVRLLLRIARAGAAILKAWDESRLKADEINDIEEALEALVPQEEP